MSEKEGIDPERLKIYQQYAEQENKNEKPLEEILQEQRESETPKSEVPAEQAPIEPEEKKEPTAEEKDPAEVEQDKKEKEKLENLKKALDEERNKRKKLREEKEILEARLRAVEERQEPIDEQPISDYEVEIKNLNKKIRSIELMEARREEQARQDAIKEQSKKLDQMVSDVSKSLTAQGYPGFSFLASNVTKELIRINTEDPEEAQSLDNPSGWEKIYKEIVFPKFKDEYETSTKKNLMDKKKDLKESANLSTSSGKAPQKKDEDDPNTWSKEKMYEEYKKIRGL